MTFADDFSIDALAGFLPMAACDRFARRAGVARQQYSASDAPIGALERSSIVSWPAGLPLEGNRSKILESKLSAFRLCSASGCKVYPDLID
jgi:hypothetical protein